MKRLSLLAGALLATPAFAATPSFGTATNWTTTIDAATYGSTGSITFNDWGYKGPTGVGANNFQVGSGFDSSQIGQIQDVVTKPADWNTPDPTQTVQGDLANTNIYSNSNMDSQVQLYKWGYTTTDTTANASHFKQMEIDKAGNYYVPKANMQFGFYNTFMYKNGSNPVQAVNTGLNFQPLAISDAKGWCGSVLATSPNAVQPMGGQVTFDFAFKVYFDTGNNSASNPGNYSSTQIVPGFIMRSYGSYDVNVTTAGGDVQHFTGSAVMNNTNPLTGLADANYQNQVSFLGAGVVPLGAWVFNDNTANVTVAAVQGAAGTANGQTRSDGATWHANAFAGYAFLMRADANRTVTYINPNGWSDYVAAVPEPSSYAMMGAGLGLVGLMARRRNKRA